MKILLDEMMPRPLKQELQGHNVFTVQEMHCKNGALIQLAVSADFEVLLTADRSLTYQQNIAELSLAVIVVATGGIRLEDLLPAAPAIREELAKRPKPGTVGIVGDLEPSDGQD
jgi:hypothetical protein